MIASAGCLRRKYLCDACNMPVMMSMPAMTMVMVGMFSGCYARGSVMSGVPMPAMFCAVAHAMSMKFRNRAHVILSSMLLPHETINFPHNAPRGIVHRHKNMVRHFCARFWEI